MKKVLNLYKPVGYTPLQLIKQLKRKYPQYKDKKLAYAGRLDPMAHGVLILLVEPETKKRKKYQSLDKEYEFKILFGVETDTYDVLGIPQKVHASQSMKSKRDDKTGTESLPVLSESKVDKIARALVGKQMQKYPPYSSKTVKGRPLFWWARKGKLNEIEIPEKKIEIYSAEFKNLKMVDGKKLKKKIIQMIEKVEGDFRQEEIIKGWNNFLKRDDKKYPVATLNINCTSGTYVRGLAHQIGQNLSTGAIALEILRKRVGDYKLESAEKFNHP